MRELDRLLFDLLEGQTFVIESYKHLIKLVEDQELQDEFVENFKQLASNHKEIIFHLKEKLEGLQPDSEYDEDEEDEG